MRGKASWNDMKMKRFLKNLAGFALLCAMSLAFGWCVCIGIDRQAEADRITEANRRIAERWHYEEYLPAMREGRKPLTQSAWMNANGIKSADEEGGAL